MCVTRLRVDDRVGGCSMCVTWLRVDDRVGRCSTSVARLRYTCDTLQCNCHKVVPGVSQGLPALHQLFHTLPTSAAGATGPLYAAGGPLAPHILNRAAVI